MYTYIANIASWGALEDGKSCLIELEITVNKPLCGLLISFKFYVIQCRFYYLYDIVSVLDSERNQEFILVLRKCFIHLFFPSAFIYLGCRGIKAVLVHSNFKDSFHLVRVP